MCLIWLTFPSELRTEILMRFGNLFISNKKINRVFLSKKTDTIAKSVSDRLPTKYKKHRMRWKHSENLAVTNPCSETNIANVATTWHLPSVIGHPFTYRIRVLCIFLWLRVIFCFSVVSWNKIPAKVHPSIEFFGLAHFRAPPSARFRTKRRAFPPFTNQKYWASIPPNIHFSIKMKQRETINIVILCVLWYIVSSSNNVIGGFFVNF